MSEKKYILAIDQSTSGTKALLFDEEGQLLKRSDCPHKQIISQKGWVEHDPVEIYNNTLFVVKDVVEKSGINKDSIIGLGISNQRETAMAWDKKTGEPVFNAVVWQCARGAEICNAIEKSGHSGFIKKTTGLHLSPYFSAAKLSWILQNVDEAKEKSLKDELCCGTMDSWLLWKLTGGKAFKTDYSNASRTQLLNLEELKWDEEVLDIFGLKVNMLPEICDSNSDFGQTDFEGYLNAPVKIHSILGDSHGALFGQGCLEKGMIKTTYGTGSSVMMNIGKTPIISKSGVVTSVAWSLTGNVDYVLEGNINYTGSVMKWISDDLGLLSSPKDASKIAMQSNKEDTTYLVPAFTGLGAPYWDSKAKALLYGMTRSTGKAEIVKAAEECIAYQISDIVGVMSKESGIEIEALRVDGGPTRDEYLMQFQCDILNKPVEIPQLEELSGIGVAYAAGMMLDNKKHIELAKRILDKLEHPIDHNTLIGDLRVGQQQMIEIARNLVQENLKILIMDEPTSSLSAQEVEVLFKIINELKQEGISIIYISHRLEEIMRIGDYVTVLRDGKLVAEAEVKDISVSWIVTKMVGSEKFYVKKPKSFNCYDQDIVLKVEDLTLPKSGGGYLLDHVSFDLYKGEILGIYGLMGAGRTEIFECLMGLRPEHTGKVTLNGKVIEIKNITQQIERGFALTPEDRQREGLVQTMSIGKNISLSSMYKYTKAGVLQKSKEDKNIFDIIKNIHIKVANKDLPILSLSGGNQQKVVIGKGILTKPQILLLDEPSRGIDVAAKAEVFDIINQYAEQKVSNIVISSDLKEIMGIADRIIVLSNGKKTAELVGKEINEQDLVTASYRGRELADPIQ